MFEISGEMERSTQSSHWLAHWKSTCKLQITMANVSNRAERIKNIDKVTCKDDEVAETSSKGLKSINVESMQNRKEFDIFNTWARGLCFDSRIQLQNTKDKIKSLNFIEDHRNVVPALVSKDQMPYTNLPHSECEDIYRNIHSSFERNGETTRICTTVDSSGKHSRFSQTTHSLLITKKSDCNLFKADRAHRNSRKGTDFGRYSLSSVTPPIRHVQHGVKPPSLHRFMDSEPREKFKGIYYGLSKLASVEENNDENANVFEDPKGKKIVHDSELEIMNLEAQTSSLDYKEPSFSRTQSLDKETVLSHVEPVNGSLKPDPGHKRLKHLRLNDSDSYSTGTKRSDCMEKSHANASKNHSKELMMVDEGTTLKTRDSDFKALLSKSWIRRWCPKKNPNAEMGGENHSSKQFPSIAAMALMAKTMNCLEPYDVQNRGTFMVWSTKGF